MLYKREQELSAYNGVVPYDSFSRGIVKTGLSTVSIDNVLVMRGAKRFYESQVNRDFDSFVDLFSPNVFYGVKLDSAFKTVVRLEVLSTIIQHHSSLVPDWWFFNSKMLDSISFEGFGRVLRESYDASRLSTVVPKVLKELNCLEPLDALTYLNIVVLAGHMAYDTLDDIPPHFFGGINFSNVGEYISDIRIPLMGVPKRFDESLRTREMRRALLAKSRSCTHIGDLRRAVHTAYLLPESSLSNALNHVSDDSFDSEPY